MIRVKRSTVNGQRSSVNRQPLLVFFLLFVFFSCNSPYIPKPTGYFKINFPEKKYQEFNKPGYPYTFEYPVYANVIKDTTFFDSSTENPWWVNVDFPQFNARIYLSYKIIGQYKLDSLLNDAYNLTNKHSIKASFIDDSIMNISNNVHGTFFKVEGDVATADQFFLTDSTKNFIRGALYFNATPNQDSLRPVNNFLVEDMKHLINTFRWK
ncbi:gliding motility lipoprotein GldD [Parafilimonas terrae]|uniref:Gliding motility-associated lipoprotein GldD n=1 Tax=Parafilimonas terrae TaxID=1465490 RepID=A0A1I5V0L8_9BACT|nr:gliding motility lipoprotein GldD [Parafilimonas terrae]SFQ01040.1 gliding motility-associated lipoprotein GldD [Parafilimonas terrae]